LEINPVSNAGSAYIYYRSGTTWSLQQKIIANDREVDDYFGSSVSISGDYVIAGAWYEDHDASGLNTLAGAGSAYIFKRNGTRWTQQQKIVASDRGSGDYFGFTVSITENYAIVGAYNEDENVSGGSTLTDAGSAYIFKLNGSTWSQLQKIVASDRYIGDFFGYSVSISGSYAIIGAIGEDEDISGGNTIDQAGSAYIFNRIDTTWIQHQKIVSSDRGADEYYGMSVSIDSAYAIIGSYMDSEDAIGLNTKTNAGSAFILHLSGTNWSQISKIVAGDRAASDYFGISVSLSGDKSIVGAYFEDEDPDGNNTISSAGSAYIFKNKLTEQLSINDTTIENGNFECFNAYDTIKIAEDGNPVIIENNATGIFIAGKSVRFFPGFTALSGSTVDAHITTDSTFCDQVGKSLVINPDFDEKFKEKKQPVPANEKSILIYPNPNNGRFYTLFSNLEGNSEICVYNITGELIHRQLTNLTNTEINLPFLKRGIYFVRVINGKDHFTNKIIIN
jgi:hypothetical protein